MDNNEIIGYKLRGGGSVIGIYDKVVNQRQLFKCQCKCGTIFAWAKYRIIGNNSCKPRYGCKKCYHEYINQTLRNKPTQEPSNKIKDMVHQRFGRLYILSIYDKIGKSHYRYQCQCDCGNITIVQYPSLKFGKSQSCGCLRTENMPKGCNHHAWNPNLTDIDRNKRRDEVKLKYLGQQVFKRDNFECKKCLERGCYLISHHLNGYHWYIIGRYDINNLITLCKVCHNIFHKRFGRKYNTKAQFYEFLEK